MAQLGSSRRAFWVVPLIALIALVMLSPSFSAVTQGTAGALPAASPVGAPGAAPVALPPSAAASTAAVSSSAPTTASEVHALLQARPSFSSVPWIENLLNPAKGSAPLVSLPNLALLEHPAKVVNGEVALSYTTQPAPMGLADFGLGANGPYALNVSSIAGSITFATPPAATNPGSQEVIAPSEQTLGAIGSPYTFGIQLNTILQNVELPGVSNGTFWTQNVVNMNSTGIHFVQDVFNFTYGSGAYIRPGTTIVSGCSGFNLTTMLTVYGGVYQCVGGTVPIGPIDFPMTLTFYNNASINSNNQDVLTFGYLFTGANGFHSGGTLDQLVFNSPGAPLVPPAQPPQFTINGFETNGIGLYNDAELTLAGGIGGANGVFSTINSVMSLQYTNYTNPKDPSVNTGYRNFPSAYNFGDDTGETSTGVATYWTGTNSSNAVVHEDSGPSLLYGLWNSRAGISAASGAIQIAGTITPGYGFVFASNVDPSVSSTNLSYVPTVSGTGSFSTMVPPPKAGSVIPNGWYFQSWAPKAAERNGSNAGGSGPVTSSVAGYDITLNSSASLNAPLYMFGDAQAASLALNVTGSATAPLNFSRMVISPNITFRHLNDFGFPTFVLFQAEDLTQPVQVNDISQSNTTTTYIYDSVQNRTLGFPSPPAIFTGLENYSTQFNIWGSSGASLSDLSLAGARAFPGAEVEGGVILLWGDSGASVTDVAVSNASYGIFVGLSLSTTISTVSSATGANAVDDVSSLGTSVQDVTTSGANSFGVYGLSSVGGSYSSISATDGSFGLYAGEDLGIPYYNSVGISSAAVAGVSANGSYGVYIALSSVIAITHATATDGAIAVVTIQNVQDSIGFVTASSGSVGFADQGSAGLVVTNVTSTGDVAGVELDGTHSSLIYGVSSSGDLLGVYVVGAANNDTITRSTFFADQGYGVALGSGTSDITVYLNNFIGNNGAGSTYNPLNAQAYTASATDQFYLSGPAGSFGNFWSDDFTPVNGAIPPYPIPNPAVPGGITYDWYPLASAVGAVPATYTVTFTESGLGSGATWSATLNGVLKSSTGTTIVFTVPAGSYAFIVPGIPGYTVFPNSGTIMVSANYEIPVTFSGVSYSVAIAEGGLPAGTTWSVTLGGTTITTNQTTATFIVPNGTYTYVVANVTGYTITSGPSGTVVVSGAGSIQTVGFAKIPAPVPAPAPTGLFGLSLSASYALLAGLVIVAILVGVLAGFYGGRASQKKP